MMVLPLTVATLKLLSIVFFVLDDKKKKLPLTKLNILVVA